MVLTEIVHYWDIFNTEEFTEGKQKSACPYLLSIQSVWNMDELRSKLYFFFLQTRSKRFFDVLDLTPNAMFPSEKLLTRFLGTSCSCFQLVVFIPSEERTFITTGDTHSINISRIWPTWISCFQSMLRIFTPISCPWEPNFDMPKCNNSAQLCSVLTA